MQLGFNRKLKTLSKIVAKYVSYKPKKCTSTVRMDFDKIMIHVDIKSGRWDSKTVLIPKSDIDIAIKRYRDLLRYEKQKFTENNKKKRITDKKIAEHLVISDKINDLESKLNKIML